VSYFVSPKDEQNNERSELIIKRRRVSYFVSPKDEQNNERSELIIKRRRGTKNLSNHDVDYICYYSMRHDLRDFLLLIWYM